MTFDHPTIAYLVALLLTLVVEIPLVVAGLRRWYRVPARSGATIAVLASLLTHPIVWFVLPGLLAPGLGWFGYLLLAEGFAWLAEAGLFWLVTRRDPIGLLLLSLVANLASFSLGALIQALDLWDAVLLLIH